LIFTKRLRVFLTVLCHVVYLVSGIPSSVFSQESYKGIIEKLTDEGFENVSVSAKHDTLLVFYENRRFRFEPRGMAELINIVANNNVGSFHILELVLLNNQVPMLTVSLPFEAYHDFFTNLIEAVDFNEKVHASFDVAEFTQTKYPVYNSSRFKVDLPVIPTWSAKFGNFDNPVESNINLVPELNSTLGKGLTLKAQLIIPVQNDFLGITKKERGVVRPGNITLNQFISLTDNFYMDITAGFFNKNRGGINFDIRKLFAEGRFQIGTNIGYTGYYSFTGIETEHYDKQKYLTAIIGSQYRYNPYDMVVRFEIGNFLYNVFTARFEVLRQFGEVQIGFFALATKDEYDGGFRFLMPLPPGRYGKLRIARIRPAEAFGWEYRAKGFPQNGVTSTTGYNLTDRLLDYNPDFIKKRLILEINKLKK
jgi:hypothetical protein